MLGLFRERRKIIIIGVGKYFLFNLRKNREQIKHCYSRNQLGRFLPHFSVFYFRAHKFSPLLHAPKTEGKNPPARFIGSWHVLEESFRERGRYLEGLVATNRPRNGPDIPDRPFFYYKSLSFSFQPMLVEFQVTITDLFLKCYENVGRAA